VTYIALASECSISVKRRCAPHGQTKLYYVRRGQQMLVCRLRCLGEQRATAPVDRSDKARSPVVAKERKPLTPLSVGSLPQV